MGLNTLRQGSKDEKVVLSTGQSAVLGGAVTVSASEAGFIQVDFDPSAGPVMLRITEAIELHDGDLVAAGSQWMSFHAATDKRPARLDLLDASGDPLLTFSLDRPSLSFGRRRGDVVLARDTMLSSEHMRVLTTPAGTFLEDLGSTNGTWAMVRPGEQLPAGSVLDVGDRLYHVSAPPAVIEPSEDELTCPLQLHTAA